MSRKRKMDSVGKDKIQEGMEDGWKGRRMNRLVERREGGWKAFCTEVRWVPE